MFQVGHQALLEPLIRGDAVQDEVRHVLGAVTAEQRTAEVIHVGSDLHVAAGRERKTVSRVIAQLTTDALQSRKFWGTVVDKRPLVPLWFRY